MARPSLHTAAGRVVITALFAGCLAVCVGPGGSARAADAAAPASDQGEVWIPPEVGALKDDAFGRTVRRGHDLFTATFAHIGPDVTDPAKRYAGNNLACGNCHLQAGREKYALPVYGILRDFPMYSSRSGRDISLADRLNSCMERSMNGRAMPEDAPEMQALLAYIGFLSAGLPQGTRLAGYGAGRMPELDRAADPARGRPLYDEHCAPCHALDGRGIWRSAPWVALGYMVPPLWGSDSFNTGAGMSRLINAANFIHSNMPHGVDYLNPALSVEESWDVAAYVLSHARPEKAGQDRDFPDLLSKPVDTPYGPYADGFPQEQHRYGPFAPIRAELDRLRASAPK